MRNETMSDGLFGELVEAVGEAVAYHRGEKLNLRTTVLPDPPRPLTSSAVKRLRTAVRVSQAVFARYLNVSTKLVQAWEGGARPVDGPALMLLRIATQHPELVFPVHRRASTPQKTANGAVRTVPARAAHMPARSRTRARRSYSR